MNKPTAREIAAERRCPNSGKPSPARRSPRGPAPLYCRREDGRDCKREMANRHLVEGASLVPFLKAWRVDRGAGDVAQLSFKRVCSLVDSLIDNDRRLGRLRPDYYAAVLLT